MYSSGFKVKHFLVGSDKLNVSGLLTWVKTYSHTPVEVGSKGYVMKEVKNRLIFLSYFFSSDK